MVWARSQLDPFDCVLNRWVQDFAQGDKVGSEGILRDLSKGLFGWQISRLRFAPEGRASLEMRDGAGGAEFWALGFTSVLFAG